MHWSWVSGFNSCFLHSTSVQEDRRRGKGRCWMTREDEGALVYRLHLLQNRASSPSSIPRLISANNLPLSSCPNRESRSLRVSGEGAESLPRSIGWWWSDKAGRKTASCLPLIGSDRSLWACSKIHRPQSNWMFYQSFVRTFTSLLWGRLYLLNKHK